jgi:hypothetical protein
MTHKTPFIVAELGADADLFMLHVYAALAEKERCFMLPGAFSEEGAAEKHMAQLQHNMSVVNAGAAELSIITGGGKWVQIAIGADPRCTSPFF